MLAYMSHKKDARLIWANANTYNTDVNSGDPDQMPHSVASVLDLHCLHMSHRKYTRLIWVNANVYNTDEIRGAICEYHEIVLK